MFSDSVSVTFMLPAGEITKAWREIAKRHGAKVKSVPKGMNDLVVTFTFSKHSWAASNEAWAACKAEIGPDRVSLYRY